MAHSWRHGQLVVGLHLQAGRVMSAGAHLPSSLESGPTPVHSEWLVSLSTEFPDVPRGLFTDLGDSRSV